MTITGWGLKGTTLDDVEVLVDGVSCKVTSSTLEEITCVTGEAAAISNANVKQPGSPGLTTRVKDKSPYWDLRTDTSVAVSETFLMTDFDNVRRTQHYDGIINSGWFKAPETGNYRFYISCDDMCELLLDETNPFNKAAPTDPTLVRKANRNWAG